MPFATMSAFKTVTCISTFISFGKKEQSPLLKMKAKHKYYKYYNCNFSEVHLSFASKGMCKYWTKSYGLL